MKISFGCPTLMRRTAARLAHRGGVCYPLALGTTARSAQRSMGAMGRNDTEAKTRFEAVLLQMRELILSGQLPPGSRVQEIAIGERLGVSRTPVRLSLSVLEQEGLVSGEPNRGFTVRRFSAKEMLGAFNVRAVLEGYACRLVAERGLERDVEQALEACLATGTQLLAIGHFDETAVREWSDMNGRFHDALVNGSDNPALAKALDLVNRHPLAAPNSIVFRTGNLARLFESMRQAHADHERIVAALKRGEAARAEALMAEHVYGSRDIAQREIDVKGFGLPQSVTELMLDGAAQAEG